MIRSTGNLFSPSLLQQILAIPGLAGYWPADPAYLYEDSAGTIPANTDGTGVVGYWRRAGAAPVYTPVSINNPGFDTDTGWTKGTGWSIADGVAAKVAGATDNIYQGYSFAAGTAYRITYTMTRTSATGSLNPYLFGGSTLIGDYKSAAGTYQQVFVAVTGNSTFGFTASITFEGTLDNVVVESIANWGASQATTTKKPILRRTPTSNVYWLNSDADDGLTATLGNLGSACTVARAGAEGVTFTEGVTISSTYNIAPAFGFNGDVAVFNRALTVTEKALLTRYMQRAVPVLGANLVTNGTFDTGISGWTGNGVNANLSYVDGKLNIETLVNYGRATVPVTLNTGAAYLILAQVTAVSAVNAPNAVNVTVNSDGSSSLISNSGPGNRSVLLVYQSPNSAIRYLSLQNDSASAGIINAFDNISLKAIL